MGSNKSLVGNESVAQAIEHTLLKPSATAKEIINLCHEAIHYNFAAVCVQSIWCDLARQQLQDSSVRLVTVAGFPHGAIPTACKLREAEYAFSHGADELDFVVNLGWLKGGDYNAILREFAALRMLAKSKILKVILETCELTEEEKKQGCELALEGQIDFVKTSTGFGKSGANLADVKLLFDMVKGEAQVKASGGIRDLALALTLLEGGATRIGTSHGIKMVQELHCNG